LLPVIFSQKVYSENVITFDRITIIASPESSPLEIVFDPKNPKQPVPASDAADYLKTVPGFSSVRSGGANGDIVFRGMLGSRNNILTDGGNVLGGCPNRMDSPASYISPELYDSVKIIKGPQTTLYGGGVSGATVLFEKHHNSFAQSEKNVDIKLGVIAADFNRIGANVDAAAGNKNIYFRVSANHDQSSDYKDGNGETIPSEWKKWNTDAEIGFTPNEDTLIELGGGGGDGYARYAGRGMDGSQFKRESGHIRIEKKNISAVLSKFEFQSYYNRVDHVMDNYSLRPAGMMSMLSNPARTVYGGRTAFTLDLGEYNNLISGVDAQFDEHESRMKKSAPFIKDIKYDKYAVFSELTTILDKQNKVIAGLRLDNVNAKDFRSGAVTNGEIRSAFLPGGFARFEHSIENILWYAGLGHTQRFPDYWELSQTIITDSGDNVFKNLSPEKTTQIDIGLQYKTDDVVCWISAYAGIVNDFILFNYTNTMMSTAKSVQNIDAHILGSEIGFSYSLTENLKTENSIAYAYGQNASDNRALPQIPPLETRLGLAYETKKIEIGLLWRLAAKQNRISIDQGTVVGKDFGESKAFSILSANVGILLTDNVKLSLGADNIFDAAYYEHLNMAGNAGWGFSANEPINEPGRTFWVKFNVDF
jgi:iron complex outermembrane receptor protein